MGSKFNIKTPSTGLQLAVGIFIIGITTSFIAGAAWQRTIAAREFSLTTLTSIPGPNSIILTLQNSTMVYRSSPTLSPFPPATYTPSPSPTPSQLPTTRSTLKPTPIDALTVLINEIAWAGTKASGYDEWLELLNPNSIDINLTGWRLVAEDGSPDILLNGTIKSNGFFLLERTDDDTIPDISSNMTYTGSLKNTGEALLLLDPTGRIIDSANLSGGAWPAGESATRVSMERKGRYVDSPNAWATNAGFVINGHDADGNAINGTPKQANSVLFKIPTVSPTITTEVSPTPTATTTLTPSATSPATSTYTPTSTNTLSPTLTTFSLSTATNTLTVTNTIIPTNTHTTTATPNSTTTPTAEDGELVFNEFLADPASGENGDANGDGIGDYNQDEFIEIVNNSGVSVNISHWVLQDSITMRHIFPEGTLIPAHCVIIVFGGGTPTGEFGGALTQISSTNSLSLSTAGGDTVSLYNEIQELVLTYTYGTEGNDNQSITRFPDIFGVDPMVKHSTISSSLFSPGTTADGLAFSGCNP